MSKHQVQDIRNIALVGHGAAGKTTLADLLLFKAGIANRAGSVQEGTSLLDTDDEARERKHSTSSTLIHLEHNGKRLNIIDTPGYPDFIGQAIGALRAVENAVICVNAHSGIEVNTRKVFEKAHQAGVGRLIIITKCDTENIAFDELLENIRASFGQCCVPITLPVGLGSKISGVVNVLNPPAEAPAGVPIDLAAASKTLMECIVEADEELMMRYFDEEKLSPEEVNAALVKAVAAGTLIPIFCISADKQIGIQELLDGLAACTLSPVDVKHKALTDGGEEVEIEPDPEGPLVAQVFKTRIDPFVAKLSYLRIYSGKLAKDSSAEVTGVSKAQKFHQLLDVQGGTQAPTDLAGPGDIVAVVKMDELHTGQTVHRGTSLTLPVIPFPTPMIGLAVEPKSRNDQTKISSALHKIEEEDPTFRVSRDPQTKEMIITGMSELHLKLVQHRLSHRDHVEVITHKPKIPYREAATAKAEGHYRHKKQSGGSGQFAEVHLRISGCPQDIDPEEYFTRERFEGLRSFHYIPELNCAFLDCISGGSVPNQYIPAVEKGFRERLEQGVLAGFQVQDTVCALFFGKDHPVDSNETAFRTATRMCFKEVFMKAKPVLLEPVCDVEIVIPDDKVGSINGDLSTRRGRVEGTTALPGGFQSIHAKVPLAELMTYQRSLSSMTGGEGSFTMDFSHYEQVPPQEQQKIVAEATHSDEEE